LFPSIHETINETSLFRDRHPDRSNVKPVEQEHIGVTLWASVNLMPVVFIFFPSLYARYTKKVQTTATAWQHGTIIILKNRVFFFKRIDKIRTSRL
jgi:hypothetical protein